MLQDAPCISIRFSKDVPQKFVQIYTTETQQSTQMCNNLHSYSMLRYLGINSQLIYSAVLIKTFKQVLRSEQVYCIVEKKSTKAALHIRIDHIHIHNTQVMHTRTSTTSKKFGRSVINSIMPLNHVRNLNVLRGLSTGYRKSY